MQRKKGSRRFHMLWYNIQLRKWRAEHPGHHSKDEEKAERRAVAERWRGMSLEERKRAEDEYDVEKGEGYDASGDGADGGTITRGGSKWLDTIGCDDFPLDPAHLLPALSEEMQRLGINGGSGRYGLYSL